MMKPFITVVDLLHNRSTKEATKFTICKKKPFISISLHLYHHFYVCNDHIHLMTYLEFSAGGILLLDHSEAILDLFRSCVDKLPK